MMYWEMFNSKDLLMINDAKLGVCHFRPGSFFYKWGTRCVKEGNEKFHLSLSKITTNQFLDIPILSLTERSFKI